MPNSPKCPKCLEDGIIAQTFRRAASADFKCHVCKTMFNKSEFEPIEFEWLEKPKDWNKFHGLRQSTPVINGKLPKAAKEKTEKSKGKNRGT